MAYRSGRTIILYGAGWDDVSTTASFAFLCIGVLVTLACLCAQTVAWKRIRAPSSRYSNLAYFVTAFMTLVSFVLQIVDIALGNQEATVRDTYYVSYVFIALATVTAHVLILLLYARFVQDSMYLGRKHRNVTIASTCAIVVLTALAIGQVAVTIVNVVGGVRDNITVASARYYNTVLAILALVFVLVTLLTVFVLLIIYSAHSRVYETTRRYRGAIGLLIFILLINNILRLPYHGILLSSYSRRRIPAMSITYLETEPILNTILWTVELVLLLMASFAGSAQTSVGAAFGEDKTPQITVTHDTREDNGITRPP